jgi:prefoldin subunit 5
MSKEQIEQAIETLQNACDTLWNINQTAPISELVHIVKQLKKELQTETANEN